MAWFKKGKTEEAEPPKRSKVAVLMAMPRARGLIHKAVIQSASSLLGLATMNQATRKGGNEQAGSGAASAEASGPCVRQEQT